MTICARCGEVIAPAHVCARVDAYKVRGAEVVSYHGVQRIAAASGVSAPRNDAAPGMQEAEPPAEVYSAPLPDPAKGGSITLLTLLCSTLVRAGVKAGGNEITCVAAVGSAVRNMRRAIEVQLPPHVGDAMLEAIAGTAPERAPSENESARQIRDAEMRGDWPEVERLLREKFNRRSKAL